MIEIRHEDDGTATVYNGEEVISDGHSSGLAALESVKDHPDLPYELLTLLGREPQPDPSIFTAHL